MFTGNKSYNCRNTIVEIEAISFKVARVVVVAEERARDKKNIEFYEAKQSATGTVPQTAPNTKRRLKFVARLRSIA